MNQWNTALAKRIAHLALGGITRELPNKPAFIARSKADWASVRSKTPCFYGCFDWHSAVHTHWSLVRLLALLPSESWAGDIEQALQQSLTSENLQIELGYRSEHPRFEMPYGVAWLLRLGAEVETSSVMQSSPDLNALCQLATQNFRDWLSALPCAIRSGEHSSSAFAMGLAFDSAHLLADENTIALIKERAREFYADDKDAPTHFEPSAYDFVSPSLAEADLLTRVMEPEEFKNWFSRFWVHELPQPVATKDRNQGKLAHWDGLNLSRAWMLQRIANKLPRELTDKLSRSAQAHLQIGMEGLNSDSYAVTHWIGSFILYALTEVAWPTSDTRLI
jgi:hypothetical protein